MAVNYISQIKLPDGSVYSIKDAEARELIGEIAAKGISFVISTNAANTPYGVQWDDDGTIITGTLAASAEITSLYLVPAKVDDRTFYAEYACIKLSNNTYIWEKLGDTDVSFDSLGALAYKDTASGSLSIISAVSSSFSGSSFTSTGSFTPEGSTTVNVTTSSITSTGTITASGSVSKPNVTVTTTSNTSGASKVASNGSVTAGSAASFTSGTFSGGSFTQGTDTFSAATHAADSFNANTPTSVTLPTFSAVSILTGVSAELAAAPTFTGSAVDVSVTANPSTLSLSATFTGSSKSVSVTGTPTGSVTNTYTTTSTSVVVS